MNKNEKLDEMQVQRRNNIGAVIIVITVCSLIFLAIIVFGNISIHKSDSGED